MKKNIFKILTFLFLAAAVIGCSKPISFNSDTSGGSVSLPTFNANSFQGVTQLRKTNTNGNSEYDTSDSYRAFATKMRSFSTKMSEVFTKENYKSDKNFAISPYSIELCLGLAIRCTNGDTRQEILDAIGVDYETFNRYYLTFFNHHKYEKKNPRDNPSTISLPTNSIWIQKDVKLKDECLDALQNDYACDAFYADFLNHNSDANRAIQNYIHDKTKGLLSPDLDLDRDTMFMLMNTIYLKDIWPEGITLLSRPLDETYRFKNATGSYSAKQLMGGSYMDGKAIENDDYSAFYFQTENRLTITFIKPNEGKAMTDVFTKENIDYVLEDHYICQDDEKKEKYHTCCVFPEFEAYADFDLKSTFINKFNVKKLFGNCDFSNITDESTCVSDFKHIAKINVDKEGIEAAAVTYMVTPMMGPGDDYKEIYKEFIVDKEFGYVISCFGDVLFSGVVSNIN